MKRGAVQRLALMLLLVLLAGSLTACRGDQSGAYSRAIDLFGQGEYAEAADAFERIGEYQKAATYAAYARGLALYGQGDYTAAAPYFEKTQDFMFGGQRYRYCTAYGLQESGQFAGAAELFLALADFEDAPLRYAYCTARDAEQNKDYQTALVAYEQAGAFGDAADRLDNLQSQIYFHAKALKKEKQYQQALQLFSLLGDYLASQQETKALKDIFRDQQYDQADALVSQGQLHQAYDLFAGLSGYRDADSRATELAARLGIAVEDAGE